MCSAEQPYEVTSRWRRTRSSVVAWRVNAWRKWGLPDAFELRAPIKKGTDNNGQPAGRRDILGGLRAEGYVTGLVVDLSSLSDIPVLFTDPFVQTARPKSCARGLHVHVHSMYVCCATTVVLEGSGRPHAERHEGGARATSLLRRFVSLSRQQLSAPGSEEVGTARAQIIAARLSCILHHRIYL